MEPGHFLRPCLLQASRGDVNLRRSCAIKRKVRGEGPRNRWDGRRRLFLGGARSSLRPRRSSVVLTDETRIGSRLTVAGLSCEPDGWDNGSIAHSSGSFKPFGGEAELRLFRTLQPKRRRLSEACTGGELVMIQPRNLYPKRDSRYQVTAVEKESVVQINLTFHSSNLS